MVPYRTYSPITCEVLRCGEALSGVLLEATPAGLATCTLTHMAEVLAAPLVRKTLCLRVEDLRPFRKDRPEAHSHRMEHLTTLDASFLQAEDSDPHVSLAVGGVSIVEGPPPDYGDLVSAFA